MNGDFNMWIKENKKKVIFATIFIGMLIVLIGMCFYRQFRKNQEKIVVTEEIENTKAMTSEEKDNTESTIYYVELKKTNSWDNSDSVGAQFDGTLYNRSNKNISDWKIVISLPDNCKVDSSWNGTYSLEGNKLSITSVDYNSEVAANGNIQFGFILISPMEYEPMDSDISIYIDSQKYTNGSDDSFTTNSTQASQNVESSEHYKIETGTPLYNHGALSVSATQLVDKNGKPYQLKGVSTHGIAWFPEYVNKEAFQTLRDDWGVNVIRLAMYTSENGGYCEGGDQEKLKELIDTGVNAANDLGMYVIIDWHILHDSDPQMNQEQAAAFFDEMSKKYAGYDNVLYEICNEPNNYAGYDATWSNNIKPYAEDIIDVIRTNDADAIIIVGTPTWSQDVDVVAKDPINGQKNIMYAVHFYAATHTDNIRNKVSSALNMGLPIFVSEFSICDASGNGRNDYDQAEKWMKLINDNKISYCGWSLSNKDETSALIQSSCPKTSSWTETDLSETGIWLRNMIKN